MNYEDYLSDIRIGFLMSFKIRFEVFLIKKVLPRLESVSMVLRQTDPFIYSTLITSTVAGKW